MLRRIFSVLLVTVVFIFSCRKDSINLKYDFTVPSVNCNTSGLTWNLGNPLPIKAIIQNTCSYSPNTGNRGCHFPGEGNYDFTQYAVVADRIRSGRFAERILLPAGHPLIMPPPGFVFDSCNFAKVMTWIENGFPEN